MRPRRPAAAHVRASAAGWVVRSFAGLVALWLVLPVLIVVPLAFTAEATFRFPPPDWSTRWFENLASGSDWGDAFRTSFEIGALVVVLSVVLGTACALGLARSTVRGKAAVHGLVLSPVAIPIIITAVGFYAVFLELQLVGETLGFVIAHTALGLPFVVVSVSTSLAGFDPVLERAAASLGAGPVATFVRVTLPNIAPGMMAGGIFAFLFSFDEVVIALFLSTPLKETVPSRMYDAIANEPDPTIAAASLILVAVTVVGVAVSLVAGRRGRPNAREES